MRIDITVACKSSARRETLASASRASLLTMLFGDFFRARRGRRRRASAPRATSNSPARRIGASSLMESQRTGRSRPAAGGASACGRRGFGRFRRNGRRGGLARLWARSLVNPRPSCAAAIRKFPNFREPARIKDSTLPLIVRTTSAFPPHRRCRLAWPCALLVESLALRRDAAGAQGPLLLILRP